MQHPSPVDLATESHAPRESAVYMSSGQAQLASCTSQLQPPFTAAGLPRKQPFKHGSPPRALLTTHLFPRGVDLHLCRAEGLCCCCEPLLQCVCGVQLDGRAGGGATVERKVDARINRPNNLPARGRDTRVLPGQHKQQGPGGDFCSHLSWCGRQMSVATTYTTSGGLSWLQGQMQVPSSTHICTTHPDTDHLRH